MKSKLKHTKFGNVNLIMFSEGKDVKIQIRSPVKDFYYDFEDYKTKKKHKTKGYIDAISVLDMKEGKHKHTWYIQK